MKKEAINVPIMAPLTPPCPSPTIAAPPHSKKLVITNGTSYNPNILVALQIFSKIVEVINAVKKPIITAFGL